MKFSKTLVVLTSLLLSSSVSAGPFGLRMGEEINGLDVEGSGNKPSLNSVPNPHPLFSSYSVWHTEETGVCRILAISKFFENDRYGQDLRSNFNRVRAALDKKYGESELLDFLKSGALWKDSDEWVMSIRQNERTYAALWENPIDDSEEPLSVIQLWVAASSSDEGFFVLEYRSADFEQCNESIESQQDSSF